MIASTVHIPMEIRRFDPEALSAGCWLVLLHVQRVPPHVGMLFSGNYNSLTIREKELDVELEALLKTVKQRKIKSAFLKIAAHPVFSMEHLLAMFQEELHKYKEVRQYESSCLSPIRNFFNEFYALNSPEGELLFDFVKRLKRNDYISFAQQQNTDAEEGLNLPAYSTQELHERIKTERESYFGI